MDSCLRKVRRKRMGKGSVIDYLTGKLRATDCLMEKETVILNLMETMKDWRYSMARD